MKKSKPLNSNKCDSDNQIPTEQETLIYEEKRTHGCAKAIKYVMRNGCWICVSHFVFVKPSQSYVLIHRNGRPVALHRHIWQLENGRLLKKGEVVKTTCGNPRCMNPDHLSMRSKFGRKCFHKRKLTMAQAEEIRCAYESGETQTALAVRYVVCQATIASIVHNRTYLETPPAEQKIAA